MNEELERLEWELVMAAKNFLAEINRGYEDDPLSDLIGRQHTVTVDLEMEDCPLICTRGDPY